MYPRSLKSITVLAAFVAITLGSSAQAQNPNVVVSPTDLKGIIGIQSGNYDWTNFNKNAAMDSYIREINKRSSHDLAYFKESINFINNLFKNIVDNDIYGQNGLKKISDRGRTNQPVHYQVFLDAINKYDQDVMELRQAIAKVSSIVTAFPSQNPIQGVNGIVNTNMPKYGDINFDAVTNFYNGRLDVLNQFLSDLPHAIRLENQTLHFIVEKSGKGLTLDIPAFQYDAEKIKQMKMQAKTLRTWQQDEMEESLDPYTLKLKQMVHTFIDTYGKTEKYRYDAGTKDLMAEELKNFVEYFYGRAYIRAVFGMPIGTICIVHDKKKFNLDKIFSSNSITFREGVISDEKDMVRCEQDYKNVNEIARERTQEVFGKGVSFFDRVNSGLQWLKGQNRLAAANAMMMSLLYNDFQDERLMYAGNLMGMKEAFTARYKSTPELLAFFNPLKTKYETIVNNDQVGDEDDSNPWGNGGGTVTKGSVMSYIYAAVAALQTQEVRLGQAKEIDKQIKQMTLLGRGQQKNRVLRGKDL